MGTDLTIKNILIQLHMDDRLFPRCDNKLDRNTKISIKNDKKNTINDQKSVIEIILNDRLGTKCKIKCSSTDTVNTLKRMASFQLGIKPEKIRIQKWYTIFKDHIQLNDYEIKDGMSLELYYQ